MQVNKNNATQFLTANGICFMIPVYQRNYDWTEENCRQLWNDIWFISQQPAKTHFIGTICSKTINSSEKSIIDGQQRITTITLLMKAMHDLVKNDAFKNDVDSSYLRNNGFGISPNHSVKLHLNRRDDAIYNKLLERNEFTTAGELGKQESESSIYRNYAYFYKRLESLNEEQILGVRNALNNLIIVDLDVENENPQEIFESLNSTGLDLTDVDLLRNYLLMSLDRETQESFYNDYWYRIEQNVDPRNMVRFFVDYLIYVKKSDAVTVRGRRAHVNENNLYTAFKDYYAGLAGETERYTSAPNVTEAILKEMLDLSASYSRLVFEDDSDMNAMSEFDRIVYSIVYLNQAASSRPVLLYILEKSKEGLLSDEETLEMLRACLSLTFRAKVSGATGINGQFAGNVLLKLSDAKSGIRDKMWQALTSGSGKFAFPSDAVFKDALQNRNIFDVLRAKGVKYLFYTLEQNSTSAKGLPRYDDRNITVEHVMPKKLTGEWKSMLGVDAPLHDDFLNKLGNLALTSYNSEMSNKPFGVKSKWYKDSSFSLTRDLAKDGSWSISRIKSRGQRLAKKCVNIWSFPAEFQQTQFANVSKRQSNFKFSMVGLSAGDEVLFVDDPSKATTVYDDSHVMFEGKKYSLSALAKELSGSDKAIRGPQHFMYEGQVLSELRDEIEGSLV